jgi:hypothetical protein
MKPPPDPNHPALSERCRRTLDSAHSAGEAGVGPDLLTGGALGKLTRAGLTEKVSSKPKRYRITAAGIAWLAEHERRQGAQPEPPADPQLSLLIDPL